LTPVPFRDGVEVRWCRTGAVALSSGEGSGSPVRHRLDYGGNRRINSVLYTASITQQRFNSDARAYLDRKVGRGHDPSRRPPSTQTPLANRVIRRMWTDEAGRQRPIALPPVA
jgi:hypothetical protein